MNLDIFVKTEKEKAMSTTTNTNSTDAAESCENCSSNFTLFKRKVEFFLNEKIGFIF